MSYFENLPSIVFATPSVPLTGDRNLPYPFSKITPSLFTLKEGSTSHLGLLPSGKKRETALLGARNRYALRLADHQRSRQIVRDGTALLMLACGLLMGLLLLACDLLIDLLMGLLIGLVLLACDLLMNLLLYKYW